MQSFNKSSREQSAKKIWKSTLHVLDKCKHSYQQACQLQNGSNLNIYEVKEVDQSEERRLVISSFLHPIRNESLLLLR